MFLSELGATQDDPDWFHRASRALEDIIAAAAGALATLDRFRGTEAQTSRAWRSRCAEVLDLARVVPDVILGVKNVLKKTWRAWLGNIGWRSTPSLQGTRKPWSLWLSGSRSRPTRC